MFFRLEARAQAKAAHDAARDELIQLSASKSTQWRAARAKELQGVMADAAKTMKAAPAVVVTDPQAAALSHYLVAAGFAATPESVSTWLTAFTVSFFEIASAFALIVARASALYPTIRQKAAGEQLPGHPSLAWSKIRLPRSQRRGKRANVMAPTTIRRHRLRLVGSQGAAQR